MYHLVVFRKFLIIYGRVGHVSVKAVMDECLMSRSSAHRYVNAMIDADLVVKVAHGRYVLKDDYEVMNGYCQAILPLDYFFFQQKRKIQD